ncbi:MAG: quercetin 2,3-dioxygenase [Nitrososphaerota archaeon]
MRFGSRAYVLADGEGKAIWFANALMVVKAATEETQGRFTCMDQRVPGNYAAPLHVHHDEDEAWYILDGEATFFCGDDRFTARAGAWVFLPRDVPHAFKTGDHGARLLTFTAPSGFADFVAASGEPAPERVIPPQGPMDVAKLQEIAARYHIEIVGPPPQ